MSGLLVVDRVTKRFGGITALDGVSFRLQAGETVGLIGPNGAGKSTLIGVVSGFIPPTVGRVHFGGVDITGWPPHRVANLGLRRTFQAANVFHGLNLEENVLIGAAGLSWSAQLRGEARRILESLRLEPKAYPAALTAGQLRLLAVARALVARPRLVMLDEPAAGLSGAELELLGKLLERFRLDGTTVLLIEHNVSLVFAHCNRVLVLDLGRLIVDGPPAQVAMDRRVVEAYLGTGWEGVVAWPT